MQGPQVFYNTKDPFTAIIEVKYEERVPEHNSRAW